MKRLSSNATAALIERTLRLGIKIVEEERQVMVESFKEGDGVVRDEKARKDIRRYDRFLRGARKVLA